MNNTKKNQFSLFKLIIFIVLMVYSVSIIYILFFAGMTSIKPHRNFDVDQNYVGLPSAVDISNYTVVFKNFFIADPMYPWIKIGFFEQLLYTILYAGGGCLLTAIAPLLMSYACSKFEYKFNEVISVLVIVTMIVPIVGGSTSMISVLHQFQLYNTIFGVYCEKFIFANMYFLIYLGILRGIPSSFAEAAYMDGASEVRVFTQIMIPMVKNVFWTIALIFFIAYWNDYQTPLLYMPSYPTLAYGVYSLTVNTSASLGLNYKTVQMAASMALILPILILFVIFKDKIMGNLTMGGEKE